MITARLLGGLGNQMFQYAAGRALALRLGVDLALDARETDAKGAHWTNGLGALRVQTVPPADLPPDRHAAPIRYALWRASTRRLIRQRGPGFDPRVTAAPDGAYLHGYFQSELYFADQAEAIRAELAPAAPLPPAAQAVAARIAAAPRAVSLHVRRGDYLASGAYGSCDAAYYARALAALGDDMGPVFAFSDDPAWVRENLDLGVAMEVVDLPGAGPEVDMALMSACAHHVIANSTFSWWGAWLNGKPGKRVVAPRTWFRDPAQDNPDLIPEGWVRV
ncbi:alpha-1,2-fucosyltransferase [Jannaschia ovalis]|uniref:Alpha-1,2-fucosyltransferase n=1 Tax=Jannaschia ovalis TaxID=3038773 RepID=A0ABY8LAV8_9RHOB|nr:alpha-1,2-fucosyltransferase [Jannaschia sp. GRR-S6-38]WGH77415.1 alpha-1,2-fucosyltransferase [Jannaschia sp. GRR-S6-38]